MVFDPLHLSGYRVYFYHFSAGKCIMLVRETDRYPELLDTFGEPVVTVILRSIRTHRRCSLGRSSDESLVRTNTVHFRQSNYWNSHW